MKGAAERLSRRYLGSKDEVKRACSAVVPPGDWASTAYLVPDSQRLGRLDGVKMASCYVSARHLPVRTFTLKSEIAGPQEWTHSTGELNFKSWQQVKPHEYLHKYTPKATGSGPLYVRVAAARLCRYAYFSAPLSCTGVRISGSVKASRGLAWNPRRWRWDLQQSRKSSTL